MLPRSAPATESPTLIRDRATSLVEYLLAVRAQIEKPVRTVPAGDAFWQEKFPSHLACEVGPASDGASWLRVGHPTPLRPVKIPREIAPHLADDLSYLREPRLVGDDDDLDEIRWRFERWRDDEWRPWAAQAARTEEVRQLHRRLFDLKHRVDMNAATDELVWGHGIIQMQVGGHRVQYPLAVTPVAIEFDADRSMVIVSPQGAARLQTDPLAGLDERYLTQLLALAGSGGQLDVDVWDDLERREFFERALRRLGQDPVIRDADESAPAVPHIHDTGVLFSRPRQRMLRRFLEELRGRLLAGDTESIGSLASVLAHEPSRLQMPDDQPQRWVPVGERLLMPLPTNEAQESIARRLAQHRNVAVQGPPGTGKTHTIRNLICHLMAHGKRVLVVAQKEDPLRVLRDGLPEEIQSLCLAVLGRSTDQLIQLQLAARELSDRGATLDKKAEQKRVERLTRQLEEAERELGQALAGLRTIAVSESVHYEIDDVQLSPSDVGAWLRERAEAYGDIPDAIPHAAAPPLTADEFTVLLDIARRTEKQDRLQALRHLPTAADFPTAATVLADREKLAAAREELDRLAGASVHLSEVRAFGAQPITDLVAHLREELALLSAREGAWTDRLAVLLQTDPNWQYIWDDHAAACQRGLAEMAAITRLIAGHQVVIADGYQTEPRRLLAQLGELRQRLATGKGVSRVFHGGLAKLASDCRIDGEPLRSSDDVDMVVAAVNRSRLRHELGARWAEWAQRLGFPLPDRAMEPEMWVGRLLAEVATALDWDRRRWPALHATIRRLVPRAEIKVDVRRLRELIDLVARGATVFEHDRLIAADRAISAALQKGMSRLEASDLWRLLDLSWQDSRLQGWDDTLREVRRLAALRPEAEQFTQLSGQLVVVAAGWAASIDDGAAAALEGSGADCLQRWQWRRTQTWFDSVVGSVDPAALGRRVEQSRERIRQLTRELVVASSWLEVSKALDDRRRAALADWTTALRKIGKGTGKNAAMWQAHAQKAMAAAVDAVPVWVMSVDRAIEQFSGGANFDVVIVDEASQADMFSLPVLSLARRAVVVGDDQQIGPQLSFVGSVTGLVNAHLTDVPSAEHFDPESSLYDHAVRRSPERILLTEHFRCVPAIIGFSSETYYGGEIEPLRTDLPQGIGDPVIAVHVPEGIRQDLAAFGNVNVAEAEALVERVAAIVADPAYEGKTIGVVSLLSTSGQALYLLSRIRETVGAEEMERRRLRVGDSYTFQGDERDIVLVSLVVSPHQGPVSAFTKRDHHRRVNVAASRARDQLWVFHSVQPADMPSDDARGKLLTYCQNVTSADEAYDDMEKRCDSDFEREVLRRVLRRGYRPKPQFPIGGYRIDFVLPAPAGRRLAIECDGDAYHGPDQWESDMRRQAVLERVGNCVFVRIRGSVFSRDPEAALEPLWQRIEELGIGPVVADSVVMEAPVVVAPTEPSIAVDARPTVAVFPVDQAAPVPSVAAFPADQVAVVAATASVAALMADEPAEPEPLWHEDTADVSRRREAEGLSDVPPLGGPAPTIEFRAATAAVADGGTAAAEPLPVPPPEAGVPADQHAEPERWADGKAATVSYGAATIAVETAPEALDGGNGTATAQPAIQAQPSPESGADVAPVPAGYRTVAWLRPYEALAALDSYKHCKDVPIRYEGKVLGWVRYYDSDSPEARKYRANVHVERAHPTGARTVCWVRPHEAKTVVRAANLKRDLPFEDSRGRHAGMVQYFPPTSPAATRFRSVTRLLRVSAASAPGHPEMPRARPPEPDVPAAGSRAEAPEAAAVAALNGRSGPSLGASAHGTQILAEPSAANPDLPDRRELEADFHRAMVRVYEQARDEAGYNATLFLRMVTEQGGLATARQLLRSPVASDGFTALWERGRPDLTVEAVVLKPRFRPLFTEDEVAIASNRLADSSSTGPSNSTLEEIMSLLRPPDRG